VSKEGEEEPYGMEVLPQKRSTWERKGKKNPMAWKSFIKKGAGEKGRGRTTHGSPTSKEEQLSKEEDELPH
jgi:hypothetical protein